MYAKTVRVSCVITRWKDARDIHGRCIDSFIFFRMPLDETMACKHVFLSAFLLFWATNPLFGNIRK